MAPLKHGMGAKYKIYNMWFFTEMSCNISLKKVAFYHFVLISGMQHGTCSVQVTIYCCAPGKSANIKLIFIILLLLRYKGLIRETLFALRGCMRVPCCKMGR
jgi:hypothetical protein